MAEVSLTDALSNVGRVAYGLLGLVVFLWWRRRDQVPRWFWPAVWAATRVGGVVLLFGILRLPAPTDTSETYLHQAQGASQGLLSYRDFSTSMAPLAPYVLALVYRIWSTPYVFVIAACLIEGLLLWLWYRSPPNIASPKAVRIGLGAYLCSALPFTTAVMGQDEIAIALLVGLLFVALDKGAWRVAAVGTGILLLTTKFTSLLFVPFLAWRSGHLFTYATVTFLIATPVNAAFHFAGADLLAPLRFEGSLFTNGNLPFLLSYFSPDWVQDSPLGRAVTLLFVGLFFALCLHYWLRRRPTTPAAFEGIILAQLLLLMIVKKSYHTYLMLVMPALMVLVAERCPRWMPWLLVLTTASVTQQSVYFRLMKYTDLSVWSWTLAPWYERLFVSLDVVMVAGYCALIVALLRTRPAES